MPVNSNIAVGTIGTIAWDGTNSFHANLLEHNRFAWSFNVVTDLTADTVFTVQSAPPSAADPLVPGAWTNVTETLQCDSTGAAGDATITLPAGLVAGTIVAATIAVRPDKFVRLVATSGDTANVQAVLLRQGPHN